MSRELLHIGILVSFLSADNALLNGNRWTLIGDLGMITADGRQDLQVITAEGTRALEAEKTFVQPMDSFVNAILDGAPNLLPFREAAYAVAFTEAMYRSIGEGRLIQVDIPQDMV